MADEEVTIPQPDAYSLGELQLRLLRVPSAPNGFSVAPSFSPNRALDHLRDLLRTEIDEMSHGQQLELWEVLMALDAHLSRGGEPPRAWASAWTSLG